MSSPRWVWSIAAVVLVAAGGVGSLLGAQTVARNDAQRSHQAFVTSSSEIASSLKLAIQQEANLVISTEAFVAANPNATNAAFLTWVRSMQVKTRYPEVGLLGFVDIVQAAELPQFVARITADPPTPLAPGQSYQVTPPGSRPFYCLTQFGYTNGGPAEPSGYDGCASYGSDAAKILARDISIPFSYVPFTFDKVSDLGVEAPVYPGGTIPTTAAARAATVLGFMALRI